MMISLISNERKQEATAVLAAGRTTGMRTRTRTRTRTTISSLFLVLLLVGNIHTALSYSDSMDSLPPLMTMIDNDSSNSNSYNQRVALFLMDYGRKQVAWQQAHRNEEEEEEPAEADQVEEDDYYVYYGKRPIPTTKERFVSICNGYLFGDEVTGDNQITNVESANFFPHLCKELKKRSCQTPIKFHNLSIDIQMAFVSAVCPRIDETSAAKDTECIKELREQVENRNKFGFTITDENRGTVEKEVDNYCTALFSLAGDFINPSMAPTRGPSSQPSIAPSKAPAGPGEPSLAPSITSIPTPTNAQTFSVSFTYMMGFDDAGVQRNVINGGRMDILDSTADTIRRVVTQRSPLFGTRRAMEEGGRTEELSRRYLRQRQKEGRTNEGDNVIDVEENHYLKVVDYRVSKRQLQVTFATNAVEHTVTRNSGCTDAFEISTDCIIMQSEVTLESSTRMPFATVQNSIISSVKSSMDEKEFRDSLGEEEVKEVVFLNDGPVTIDPRDPEVGVGGGSIAGITIGSVLFLVALAFFVGRARARSAESQASDDSIDEDDLSSAGDEYESNNSGDDERIGYIMKTDGGGKKSRGLPAIEEDQNSGTEIMKPRGLQFDPASGQVVGSAAMSYASSSVNSGYSADDPDTTPKDLENGDELVDQLDAAVHAGDWAAVAAIAGDLSQADDISTMSSYYSRAGDISYDPSDRESLATEDAERAQKIDKLIAEGDWSAVGATAAAFESETGSHTSGSEKSGKKRSIPPLPPSEDDTKRPKGRSIIDFISGPWQSTAAAKAVEREDENIVSETDSEGPFPNKDPFSNFNNNEVISVSEPSDLSAGEGPPQNSHGQLAGLGTVGAAGAKAAAAYHSESETTTDDDTKNLLSPNQKKKRSWTGRFFKKNEKEGDTQVKSLALQEDSSVSSWSRGEDSSPDTTMNLYGAAPQAGDDMPAEMRAFGEDHGLAAAERAMEEEEEKQEYQNMTSDREGSDGGLSGKSSESLRDELDRAIESGDWAAVEKQTNEMLEVGDGNTGQRRSRSLSDIDSEIDTSDGEGWSAGNQSDNESEIIDDERIEMLEKLIETDDWQGIVDNSQIHTKADDSVAGDDE